MPQDDRKNFTQDIIVEVFELQGRACAKCGKSLLFGFEAHHANNDHSNNSIENCQLLCGACHDSKLWETLREQKQASITQVDSLINKACAGEVAGAVLDKALDAIKLKLSLEGQVNAVGLLEAPAKAKLESYQMVMEAKAESFLEGYKKGLLTGVSILQQENKGKVKKDV